MDFDTLAAECAPLVSSQTMAAIVKTESQFKPFAININGDVVLERQPKTKEEAVVTAKWLIDNHYNIDMGLGQINSKNLTWTKLSVADAFDPCKNLGASATILQSNYVSASKSMPDQQVALQAAISAYNTGSFTRGFSNGYVQKVVDNAMVAGGKGPIAVAKPEIVPAIPIKKKTNLKKTRQPKVVKVTSNSSPLLDMKVKRTDMVKSAQEDKLQTVFESAKNETTLLNMEQPSASEIEDKVANIMVY